MRSSSGEYYVSLDHVRALAAFLVFVWHFNHFQGGNQQSPLLFPLSILTEGHTGVSIFLTLSGFLFAKLLADKRIVYKLFFWNRALRLFPLLIVMLALQWMLSAPDRSLYFDFFERIMRGIVYPSLPNGGWSITVEMHFYLLLPVLLTIFLRKNIIYSILILLSLLIIRYVEYRLGGNLQSLAYFTIFGRIDQFVLGILVFRYKDNIPSTKLFGFFATFSFLAYFYYFDLKGGYYGSFPNGPQTWIWIFQLTVEGFFYALLIAWYDKKEIPGNRLSKFVSKIGQYSYSIYLLHFFVVFSFIPGFIDNNIFDISNSYVKLIAGILLFILFLPIAWFSYNLIEKPFLKFRKSYKK
jgi:peptidoglycan/LPS O-acetylase OafA/YrhL